MPTRTIRLLPDADASLDRMVASGRYGTADDVIMYALAALEDQEAVRDAREARLQALLAEGLADIEAGRTRDMDEVFAELRAKLAERESGREAAE